MNKEDQILFEKYNQEVVDEGVWDTTKQGFKDFGRRAIYNVRKKIPSPLGIGDVGRGSAEFESWILNRKQKLIAEFNKDVPGDKIIAKDFVNWFTNIFENFLSKDSKMIGYTAAKNPVLLNLMTNPDTPFTKNEYTQLIEDAVRQGQTFRTTGRFIDTAPPTAEPPEPAPERVDSPIEDTADAVVVGRQKKKQVADTKIAQGRKMGTKSLQIPLLNNQKGGDLNYPT